MPKKSAGMVTTRRKMRGRLKVRSVEGIQNVAAE
jgi:hypothetical protein